MRPPSPAARLSYLDESVLAGVDARLFRDGSLIGVVAPDADDLGSYLRAAPHEDLVLLDEPPAAPVVRTLRAEYTRPFTAHAGSDLTGPV